MSTILTKLDAETGLRQQNCPRKGLLVIRKKREWDRNRYLLGIDFIVPSSAQLSRAVKANHPKPKKNKKGCFIMKLTFEDKVQIYESRKQGRALGDFQINLG